MSLPPRNPTFNIDNLNFNSIKNEITSIPKFVKDRSRVFHRSSTCENIHNNKQNDSQYSQFLNQKINFSPRGTGLKEDKALNTSDNKVKYSEDPIISNMNINNQYHNMSTTSVPVLSRTADLIEHQPCIQTINKNPQALTNIIYQYHNKIKILENDHKKQIEKIQEENCAGILKLQELSNEKINEISLLYEGKLRNYEAGIINQMNEFKTFSSSFISITEHMNIIADVNQAWKNKGNDIKNEYDNYISNLSSVLGSKEGYKALLARMGGYKKYGVDISKIEKVLYSGIVNKLDKSSDIVNMDKPEHMRQEEFVKEFVMMSNLEEDINYFKSGFEGRMGYNNKLDEMRKYKEYNYDRIIKAINKTYDDGNVFNREIGIKPNANAFISFDKKREELGGRVDFQGKQNRNESRKERDNNEYNDNEKENEKEIGMFKKKKDKKLNQEEEVLEIVEKGNSEEKEGEEISTKSKIKAVNKLTDKNNENLKKRDEQKGKVILKYEDFGSNVNFNENNRYNNSSIQKELIDDEVQISINNESELRNIDKSSIDFYNLNFEETGPNKPSNTGLVNELFKEDDLNNTIIDEFTKN